MAVTGQDTEMTTGIPTAGPTGEDTEEEEKCTSSGKYAGSVHRKWLRITKILIFFGDLSPTEGKFCPDVSPVPVQSIREN